MLKWVTLTLIVLLVSLQYKLWVGEGSMTEVALLEKQIGEQELANTQLNERNELLYAEVRELKDGLDGVEERARNELGMVKPGEQFILLMETPEH